MGDNTLVDLDPSPTLADDRATSHGSDVRDATAITIESGPALEASARLTTRRREWRSAAERLLAELNAARPKTG